MSLFPTVKTAALYLIPIKSYSKNTHLPFILEWAIDIHVIIAILSLIIDGCQEIGTFGLIG